MSCWLRQHKRDRELAISRPGAPRRPRLPPPTTAAARGRRYASNIRTLAPSALKPRYTPLSIQPRLTPQKHTISRRRETSATLRTGNISEWQDSVSSECCALNEEILSTVQKDTFPRV
ncbi:hypothetical protein J6590_047611 [Homalodisca vitripennis]|nr:hypothetical protein J6590_047611 [Homalodisca vitripennis]